MLKFAEAAHLKLQRTQKKAWPGLSFASGETQGVWARLYTWTAMCTMFAKLGKTTQDTCSCINQEAESV